jgi:hypothetical protein
MTDQTNPSRPDWAEWTRAHKVSFEIQPLVEVHKGEKVQVGFEVNLYAQMPMDAPPAEARQRNLAIWQTLREMLQSVVGQGSENARLDVGPLRTAAKLRPETGHTPEVELSARVVRRSATFEPVPEDARNRLGFLEDGLLAIGFHRGSAGRASP